VQVSPNFGPTRKDYVHGKRTRNWRRSRMKRCDLEKRLRHAGCFLKRAGGSHSLWTNPRTGVVEAVSRRSEIKEPLAWNLAELGVPASLPALRWPLQTRCFTGQDAGAPGKVRIAVTQGRAMDNADPPAEVPA
jgi:mRNA interferase HicA